MLPARLPVLVPVSLLNTWGFGEVLPSSPMHSLPSKAFPCIIRIPSWWLLSLTWSSEHCTWQIYFIVVHGWVPFSVFQGGCRLCVCVKWESGRERVKYMGPNNHFELKFHLLLSHHPTSDHFYLTLVSIPQPLDQCFSNHLHHNLQVWYLLTCSFLHFKPISAETKSQEMGTWFEALPEYYNKFPRRFW